MLKLAVVLLTLISQASFGDGYEKTNLISGRYMGIAGAATSSVSGAESIYFNPAGLGGGAKKNQIVGDNSPMIINFTAPINTDNKSESSSRLAAGPGVFYRMLLDDKWAVGVGAYTAGGNITEYSGVQYTGVGGYQFGLKPDIFTKIDIEEISVGASYKVNDKLRVGFAWRGDFANADQEFAATDTGDPTTAQFLATNEYRQMKGSNMMGYRLGIQYDFNDSCGIGIMYRNAMPVTASGKLFARGEDVAGTKYESGESDMSVKTQLPQQLAIGFHHKWNEHWKSFFDYSWTNYGQDDRLIYQGTYTLAGTTTNLSDVYIGWTDKKVVRLAGEYTGMSMPLRFGYTYTSQVTSTQYADPTFAPPSPAHTFSVGTGHSCGENFVIDGALDYEKLSGSVASNEKYGTTTRAGTYTADVYTLHLGATYNF